MAWTEAGLNPKPSPAAELSFLYYPKSLTVLSLPAWSFFFLLVLLSSFPEPSMAGPPNPARLPLLSGQPFIIFWGVPDSSCVGRQDPRTFGMEREGRVAVFYEDTLGNYPYFVDRDTAVNRGLPQHTRLDNHLQKTGEDLLAALPAPRYLGLAVLRWAEWAPQWARNREKKAVYLEASRAMLKAFFPDWTPEEVEKWSQVDFEAAARSILTETLREVRRLRPKALWGVSPYPSCYSTDSLNYTRCPATEVALNDQLLWLWKRSSALYPLLTLEKLQGGARLYLSNQIREALRVASLPTTSFDLPVFPLVKSVYASTNTFLSQADLVNTIGESAAMGAAGVVIWEKDETKTERECSDLAQFVRQVLGPYSINVTTAARLCSTSLCEGRGRCVRLDPDSSAYLHLDSMETATDQPVTSTSPDQPDPAEVWKKDFQCQWFTGTEPLANAAISDQQSPKDGAPIGGGGRGKAGDVVGPTGASTVMSGAPIGEGGRGKAGDVVGPTGASTVMSVSEDDLSGSEDDLGESSTAGTERPQPFLEEPTDDCTKPLSAPLLTAFLLLLATATCLDP